MKTTLWIFLPALSVFLIAGTSHAQNSLLEQQALIEDIRQLANIIENTHPDPYSAGGGRIAFHRRLHQTLNAVPDSGMSANDLIRLLRPFVAAVGDQHTEIYSDYPADDGGPGGLPFVFDVVEEDLYVIAAFQETDKEFVGAVLVSIEGVTTAELVDRFSRLEGVENKYYALRQLGRHNLLFRAYLKELVPEWKDTTQIAFQLQLPTGEVRDLVRSVPVVITGALSHLGTSHVDLPETDSSDFGFEFIDPLKTGEEIGYLRVDFMEGYREAHEMNVARGREDLTRDQLALFPSATETFRRMVIDMKERGTDALIIDLRKNGGGNFIMAPALVYFLYGKQRLTAINQRKAAGAGHGDRYSRLYFESNPNASLERINQGRSVPLIMGDIDFSRILNNVDRNDSLSVLEENPSRLELYQRASTFYDEYVSESYSGYYCPEHVFVLVSPFTSSSGLDMTLYLFRAGATLIGTPSAQAPNSWGNLLNWKLTNSGIEGEVSSSFDIAFPDDPQRGRVLPVHYDLTYDKLASYSFDPDATFLYAMEILAKLRE